MTDHAMTDLTDPSAQPDQPDLTDQAENHDEHDRAHAAHEQHEQHEHAAPHDHAGADPLIQPAGAESLPVEADSTSDGGADTLDTPDAADVRDLSATPDLSDAATSADGDDVVDAEGAEGADDVEGAPRRGSRVRLLEKEGEVAADFLERLLDIADLDGDIEVDIDGDRAAVAIVDSEEGRVPRRLVGADGKVLEALQELTRLAVQAETGERSRLMLDVAGHRAQRRVQLVEVARTAIAEVKTTGQRTALEDMSAFERKIVHDEVAAAGLDSESEGVEPHRHIVVFPA